MTVYRPVPPLSWSYLRMIIPGFDTLFATWVMMPNSQNSTGWLPSSVQF